MPDRIVSEELALLDHVSDVLEHAPVAEPPSEEQIIEELEQVREQLLRGTLDEFERGALTARWNVLTALRKQLEESRNMPRVDPESPYFGHLRLREGERERDLCLGKATCLDHGLRIVDWRNAPIAKLFYRYQQGEEYEETISGRCVMGEIVARRTVSIHGAQLERVDAPEGSFVVDEAHPEGWRLVAREGPRLAGGEGAALRVHRGDESSRRLGTEVTGLPRRADKYLPDIAGLIDPAQFELITKPHSGFVAIRGTAGSGKTTVALHRIAYLAFDDAEVDSARTLFLVFSAALRDYVAHVLPALGVERVRALTYAEWAAAQRARLFPKLPSAYREDTPSFVQRLKLHPALLSALERHVAEHPGPSTAQQVIADWQNVLTDPRLLEKELLGRTDGMLSERELMAAVGWCQRRREELAEWLDGDPEVAAELDPEDDALLLRLYQIRVGPIPTPDGRPLQYRHVAVDEVQDFSPLEVRVLIDCLDDRKSLTLAGDAQQQVIESSGFTSWAGFFTDLGLGGTEVDTLQVSYRSSREVTEFALEVLGDQRDPETPVITTRSGPPVEVFEFTEAGAAIAFLGEALQALSIEEPLASIALLTPDAEQSELYHQGLVEAEVPRVHRVLNQDFRFAPGIEITEFDQIKGLEFDYVVLTDVSEAHFSGDPISRRRLHVGATRAVHQLWLLSIGRPSAPVREAIIRTTRRAAGI